MIRLDSPLSKEMRDRIADSVDFATMLRWIEREEDNRHRLLDLAEKYGELAGAIQDAGATIRYAARELSRDWHGACSRAFLRRVRKGAASTARVVAKLRAVADSLRHLASRITSTYAEMQALEVVRWIKAGLSRSLGWLDPSWYLQKAGELTDATLHSEALALMNALADDFAKTAQAMRDAISETWPGPVADPVKALADP